MQLDLADLESVKKFAHEFADLYNRLDLLINNAGIMEPPYGKTKQGFELQFGINHLGHFVLTSLLLDRLNATPNARIVTVSSNSHRFGDINFDDLNWECSYPHQRSYGQSKLANLLFTYELQRRLTAAGQSTIAVASHPGMTISNLVQHSRMFQILVPFLGQPAAMGALPTLYAATASMVNGGEYFGPDGLLELRGYPKLVRSTEASYDQTVAKRLWTVSEELTQVQYQFGIDSKTNIAV